MNQFWITILSIAAGAIGYLIVTFWVQPILRYRNIKYEVAADLVYFANAVELLKTDGTVREDTLLRKDHNRKHGAELKAIYYHLPAWYRCWLKKRDENSLEASKELIRLSNSSTWRDAEPFENAVKTHLKLPYKE